MSLYLIYPFNSIVFPLKKGIIIFSQPLSPYGLLNKFTISYVICLNSVSSINPIFFAASLTIEIEVKLIK